MSERKRRSKLAGLFPKEYRAYTDAKQRCTNPKSRSYHNYGGRGIQFKFESFDAFLSDIGESPVVTHELDRINNSGNYEAGNIRWVPRTVNLLNRRPSRVNQCGVFGVCYCTTHNKWKAYYRENGNNKQLYWGTDKELAIKARQQWEQHVREEA